MVRYLQRNDIDDTLWDECIAASPNGLPYAYAWYLDVVAARQWNALVLGDYRAVFPLPYRTKWGVRYLYQPFFVQQLGVFSRDAITPALVKDMLDAIPAYYKYIELNLNEANATEHPDYALLPRVNLLLPLDKPYTEILAGFSENTRRNLQKAQKQGLVLVNDLAIDTVIGFFRKEMGEKLSDLSEADYRTLRKLMDVCLAKGIGVLKGVQNQQGQLLATGFYLQSHGRIINLLPSASEQGKSTGASAFLLDGIIQQHINGGWTMDMEGSMIEGVARFYKGFGAQLAPYWQLKRKRLPWYLKPFKQ